MIHHRLRVTASTALLLAAVACLRRAPALWMAEPRSGLGFPGPGDERFSLEIQATPLLALGDTVSLTINRTRCHADVCVGGYDGPQFSGWMLTVDPAESLERVGEDRFVARRIGALRVRAVRGDTVVTRVLKVVPPVATLTWSPAAMHVRDGDTLRACAVARDTRGQVIGIVRPDYAGIGQGMSAIMSIATQQEPCRWVATGGAGQVVLAAVLGSRVARLPVTIVAR